MAGTRRALAADGLLALVLAVVGVVGTLGAGAQSGADRPVDATALGLVLAAAAVLVVRRRQPLLPLVVVIPAVAVYLSLDYPYGPILFSFFVAVYTVARHLALRTAFVASGVALLGVLLHVFLGRADLPALLGIAPAAAWVVVPFAVGITVRTAQESRAQARAELVRRQVHEERMRVAQEVHDVVGHGLAAIKMQADVALHVLDRKPGQAETALRAISSSSAEALDELRVTLAGVRDPSESRAATPGLARLPDLESRVAQAGLRLRLETEGEPRDLPDAVDVAAYRIVQESLTNVLRHSGAGSATVRLGYDTDSVSVEVVDTGVGGSPANESEGTGIVGMRERVSGLGGTFGAGPRPDGGFGVHAVIPTAGRR